MTMFGTVNEPELVRLLRESPPANPVRAEAERNATAVPEVRV
jgi:hypothetical protein